MKESEFVPVLVNHDTGSLPIGKFELAVEVSKQAQFVADHIDQFSFEPAWLEREDGSIELLEISAVIRREPPKVSEAVTPDEVA